MSTIDAALLGEAIVLCNGNAVNLPYKKAYALLYINQNIVFDYLFISSHKPV